MTSDPFQLFDDWFAEARASEPNEPEAMALATAGADGQPSVRMVLLKAHGAEGFVFYTNEQSAKGEEMAENPRAALLFHWKSLCRQVRDRRNGRASVGGRGGRLFRQSRSRIRSSAPWHRTSRAPSTAAKPSSAALTR